MNEVWTTLAADGTTGPFYVSTSSEPMSKLAIFENDPNAKLAYVPVMKKSRQSKNVSPGERGCLAYLQYMIHEAKYLSRGDILIHDGEKAFATPSVQLYLSSHDISPFILPSVLHQFLSPCDNNFHSLFKLAYYRLISNENYMELNVKEKLELARGCYDNVSAEVIQSLFENCGLIGNQDKSGVVSRLMCQGITVLGDRGHFHNRNLLAFLTWCENNELGSTLCQRSFDFTLLQ